MNYDIIMEHDYYGTKIFEAVYLYQPICQFLWTQNVISHFLNQ